MADIRDNLFGTLAVRGHFVLADQVEEALGLQQKYEEAGQDVPRMGELLAHLGYMTPEQVRAVLQGQGTKARGLFGEIGVRWQILKKADVESGLELQRETRAAGQRAMRLGEILLSRGVIKPHQIRAILQAQGKQIVQCTNCRTRYNALHIKAGSRVACPRCKTHFVPIPPDEADAKLPEPELTPPPEALPAVREEMRADQTVEMPAVMVPSPGLESDADKKSIGPYQILQTLGADHSGTLYKAYHPDSDETVVLRLFSPEVMQGQEDCDRWRIAGKAATELDHLNLQRILSMDAEGDRAYLVMEYVEGHSLRRQIEQRGRLPQMETIEILIQCADALNYGHARDLIHGNLRPSHILIGTDRRVRIAGLGTPKKIHQDLRLMAAEAGTSSIPLYAPPEILIDELDADERTDIYNLAAVGYHMVTGVAPQSGADLLQAGFRAALQDVLPPDAIVPEIAPYLNRLMMKALQPEPIDRYETMQTFLTDLQKCRAGLLAQLANIPEIAPDIKPGRSRPRRDRQRPKQKKYKPRRQFRTYKGGGGRRKSKGVRVLGSRVGKPAAPVGRAIPLTPADLPVVEPPRPPEPEPEPLVPPDPTLDPELFQFQEAEDPDIAADEKRARSSEAPVLGSDAKPQMAGKRQRTHERVESSSISSRQPPPTRRPGRGPRREVEQERNFSKVALAIIIIGFLGVIGGLFYLIQHTGEIGEMDQAGDYGVPVEEFQEEEKKEEETEPVVPVPAGPSKADLAKQELDKIMLSANPGDNTGMIRELDQFLEKHSKLDPPPDAVAEARKQRQKYAVAGAKAAFPELQTKVTNLLARNGISEARTFVRQFEKRWGKEATKTETAAMMKVIQEKLAELEKPVQTPVETPPTPEPKPETTEKKDDEAEKKEDVTEKKADSLEGLGWRISRGTWRLEAGIMEGALDGNGDAAILERTYKPCEVISVELQGFGDAAGFSFGKGKRFLVRPTNEWQTVKLEIPTNGMPALSLNGDSRTSLEDVSKADASALGKTLSLCVLGGKVKFRNFEAK